MNMQVNITIDEFTDCLIDRKNNQIVETEYKKLEYPIHKTQFSTWKFDWSITQKNGYTIYELFVKGKSIVEGRISLNIDGGVANVDIVETAPHNYGHNGKYEGVGGHLFAIACKVSMENGYDGVVAFDAKSNLVEYYKEKLKAVEIFPRRMVIFEEAAQILIDKYFRK